MTTGSRLGPCEVVFRLGAGGMGEVHRARDTRLGRDVAIEVLPIEEAVRGLHAADRQQRRLAHAPAIRAALAALSREPAFHAGRRVSVPRPPTGGMHLRYRIRWAGDSQEPTSAST